MKIKKNDKRNKKIKSVLFLAVLPILLTCIFFGTLYKVVKYIETRDLDIYMSGYEQGYWDGGIEATTPSETLKITPVLPSNNQGSKEVILDKLAQIESGNGKVRKILDTNNRYSLGKFHFQAHTVKDMYKRYYGKNITIMEAVKIAENDELSRKLAHDAIFVKGEKFHWKISLCKLDVLKKGCLTEKQIKSLFAKK